MQGKVQRVGYARVSMETIERLKAGIEALDGLHVLGDPHATLAAYGPTVHHMPTVSYAEQVGAGSRFVVNHRREFIRSAAGMVD